MTRLTWNHIPEYDAGVDRGVYYPKDGSGEAWSGLISVTESPEADEATFYVDGVKVQRKRRVEEFSGTIEAYAYPDSFYENVLVQSRRQGFDLSYRAGDKLHLVYNVYLTPTSRLYEYENPATLSWGFITQPVAVPGLRPCSHLIVDTARAYSWAVEAFETVLYGDEEFPARLPRPAEVIDIFEINAALRIIDHGDGTWTAIAHDEGIIEMVDETSFEITWPSAVYISEDTYTISSL